MTIAVDMAAAAALVGEPARANILTALMDGRAHTSSELAQVAGIAPPTASGHLARLLRGRLIGVVAQGRHRYYRLASADVARMLEGIMTFASDPAIGRRRATPRIEPGLRRARTCYDHIAGELGVAIADRLVARGAVEIGAESAVITDAGHRFLVETGIPADLFEGTRRPACRPCLDWSERRPHLAGSLGAAILQQALRVGAIKRRKDGRALDLEGGISGALKKLGLRDRL